MNKQPVSTGQVAHQSDDYGLQRGEKTKWRFFRNRGVVLPDIIEAKPRASVIINDSNSRMSVPLKRGSVIYQLNNELDANALDLKDIKTDTEVSFDATNVICESIDTGVTLDLSACSRLQSVRLGFVKEGVKLILPPNVKLEIETIEGNFTIVGERLSFFAGSIKKGDLGIKKGDLVQLPNIINTVQLPNDVISFEAFTIEEGVHFDFSETALKTFKVHGSLEGYAKLPKSVEKVECITIGRNGVLDMKACSYIKHLTTIECLLGKLLLPSSLETLTLKVLGFYEEGRQVCFDLSDLQKLLNLTIGMIFWSIKVPAQLKAFGNTLIDGDTSVDLHHCMGLESLKIKNPKEEEDLKQEFGYLTDEVIRGMQGPLILSKKDHLKFLPDLPDTSKVQWEK